MRPQCQATSELGFDAARVGLTADEARDLASTFARFDRSGSGRVLHSSTSQLNLSRF